ncbi:MAG: carboxymuconolactone decarboxylase family protein [Desulfatirhabdiaceae bacterium]
MKEEYPELYQHLQKLSTKLAKDLRGPMSAFAQLNAAASAPGALDAKIKQLIALGIGISAHCDGCIAYHVHDAIRAGASRQEILETIGIAILMGGGPAVVYACQAMEAMDQFASSGLTPALSDIHKK